jgi:hypothetical protein
MVGASEISERAVGPVSPRYGNDLEILSRHDCVYADLMPNNRRIAKMTKLEAHAEANTPSHKAPIDLNLLNLMGGDEKRGDRHEIVLARAAKTQPDAIKTPPTDATKTPPTDAIKTPLSKEDQKIVNAIVRDLLTYIKAADKASEPLLHPASQERGKEQEIADQRVSEAWQPLHSRFDLTDSDKLISLLPYIQAHPDLVKAGIYIESHYDGATSTLQAGKKGPGDIEHIYPLGKLRTTRTDSREGK